MATGKGRRTVTAKSMVKGMNATTQIRTVKVGSRAPAFALSDRDGEIHTLDSIESEYVVLYFYPKDNTPGCTVEAKEFEYLLAKFTKANCTVVGISGGDSRTKLLFCTAQALKRLLLLSDSDFSVAKKFGSFGEKSFMGRKFQGIFRKTFVLNRDRQVVRIFDNVKPEGHAGEVLKFIRSGGESPRQIPMPLPVPRRAARGQTPRKTTGPGSGGIVDRASIRNRTNAAKAKGVRRTPVRAVNTSRSKKVPLKGSVKGSLKRATRAQAQSTR